MTDSSPLNPYVVGGALGDPTGRGFYGRDDIFTFVRSALNAEQRSPIILYGHRRIGKSSVLKQLPRVLSPELITIFFDLQGKASMELDQVLYGLGRAIADRLEIARPTREETTEGTFTKEFLVRAVSALGNHAERLVLLFDEFDVVDERLNDKNVASHRFIGYLGELINHQPRFGYILVIGRKTTELSEEFNSTLLKNSVQKRIGRLSKEEAYRLVQAPSQNYLKFTDSALERIYQFAAGHPFCTQLLCLTIWSAKISKPVSPLVEVTESDVDDALLPALEYGTNGMNWIFDGLINPAHRLFVSALAQVVDPTSGQLASFSMIANVLASKKVSIDTVEMNRAPIELTKWDIIESDQSGFKFVVPIVGVWIQQERSLDQLEKEVKYASPRAYRYYELAVEAHRNVDLDRAIEDYKGALLVNPIFLDAQKGLATALHERQKPGDLDAAIEAHERVLELDPEMPKTQLLQVLQESLESSMNEPEKLLITYKRLCELDTENRLHSRALRVLRGRAGRMMDIELYRDAARLYEIIGEETLAREAFKTEQLARNALYISGVFGLLVGVAIVLFGDRLGPMMKLIGWALATSTFGPVIANFYLPDIRRSRQARRRSYILKRAIYPTLLRMSFVSLLAIVAGFIAWMISGWTNAVYWTAGTTGLYAPFILKIIKGEYSDSSNKQTKL